MTAKTEIYAVRTADGRWFRSRGTRSGPRLVDCLSEAKLYSKIGYARARVTWWARNYPTFEAPEVVRLAVTEASPIEGEKERAKKALEKIRQKHEEADLRRTKRRLETAQAAVKAAEKQLAEERRKLKKATQ